MPAARKNTNMKFIQAATDAWHTAGDEAQPTPAAQRLLTLAQWHAVRASWPAGLPAGLRLANDADVEDLADDLPRFALVVLEFPKWTDGRAYSQAHLLRARYRYTGELRATGAVLADMMPLLARTGFDAVQLRDDQIEATARQALGYFAGHYQGDVQQTRPLFARTAPAAQVGAA